VSLPVTSATGSDILFLARLWGNIAKPAKFTLQIAAGEVQKSVGRLIAICAKLLHKTVEDSNRMIHTLHTERKGKLLI